ncbi:MAG: Crp/Fnr family transcriptional regulator [Fusobacteriaceae bacterium]|nr:Crp/Fnr family transcriptional regulator [Fusobacteriaceae bacterium]
MNNLLEILAKSSVFLGKTEEEIQVILNKIKYRIADYKKNEFIFNSSSPANSIGIIIKGSVIIQNNLATGKIINSFFKKVGDGFGGAIIFSDIPTFSCDVVAKENCTILFILKDYMKILVASDSLISSNVVSSMSKNMLKMNRQAELLTYSSIQEKIAFFLIYNSEFKNNVFQITIPYSKKIWSEFLNVSRPSLYRELKKLSAENIIEVYKNNIKIVDIKKLKSIL